MLADVVLDAEELLDFSISSLEDLLRDFVEPKLLACFNDKSSGTGEAIDSGVSERIV